MPFVVIAMWRARTGEEENVLQAITKLVAPSRAEKGCLMYQPNRDVDNPRVFVIYEQYVDEAAYRTHTETAHFRRHAIRDGIPRLESRTRSFYAPFPDEGEGLGHVGGIGVRST